MDSRTYYYARVSSKEQNLDRQIAAFKTLGAQEREIITDKESGKDLDRTGYQALKNAILRRGDTLVIKSLDRLSRNKADIKSELQFFKDNGIRLKVIDLPTTMMELPEGQKWVFEMVTISALLVAVFFSFSIRKLYHKICEKASVFRRFRALVSVRKKNHWELN